MTGEVIESTTIGGHDVVLRYVDNSIPPWNDGTFAHAKYSLRIGHGEAGCSFPFWQSESGTRAGEHPSIDGVVSTVFDDALMAIHRDGPMRYSDGPERWLDGLDEMADEMAIEKPSEAYRVWHSVNETAEKLRTFYTRGQIYEIADAARERDLASVEILD